MLIVMIKIKVNRRFTIEIIIATTKKNKADFNYSIV